MQLSYKVKVLGLVSILLLPVLLFKKPKAIDESSTELGGNLVLEDGQGVREMKRGDIFTDPDTGEELQVIKRGKAGRPKGSTKKKSRAGTQKKSKSTEHKALDDSGNDGAGEDVANEAAIAEDQQQDNSKDTDIQSG